MAYATKWTISFNSLRGVDYTVNILVDGFSGTPQRLRPAAKPITIDEDTSDNYFEPMRSQSGYIRIVNEDSDLDGNAFSYKDLIATNAQSHQVRLMAGNTLVWIGYIKPVVLTSILFGYRNTIEIPIQCPIAVLKATRLSFNSNTGTFLTMGQIIHSMFSKLNNIAWSNVYLTANVRHRDQASNEWPFPDLNSRVSMFNFSDNEDPTMASGSTFTNYTATWEDDTPCSDILEKICKFWGWTLYTRGTDIYLTAPGTVHNYYQIAFSALSSQLSAANVTTAESPADIETLEYRSTKHSEEYLQGYRKITIEADANSDDLVLDPRLEDLEYEGFQVVTYGSGNNRYKSAQAWLSNPQLQHKLFLHNCRIFENPADLQAIDKFNVLSFSDEWKVGPSDNVEDLQKMEVKNHFSMKQNTVIYARSGSAPETTITRAALEEQTYLAMTTLNEVVIPATSQLCLYAGVKIGSDPTTNYQSKTDDYIRMYLRIGDYWWTGMGWSTTMSIFNVYFNENGEFMTTRAIYSQQTLNALFPDAKGYIIHNDSQTRKGVLEVGILNYPHYRTDTGDLHQFNIIDFNVRCITSDSTVRPQNKERQKYEGVASSMFQNDLSITLNMASGTKNLYGKGQLYASRNNNERLGGLYYEGVTGNARQPERYLLESMQRVFGQTRHRMKIDVAESNVNANPLRRYSYEGKTYIMQAAKHEFGDDKMTLTLIEE